MKTLGVGIVLLALLGAAACEEVLTAHTMKHVETAENTYTAVFRRAEEGHVHVIMQPCFGRELALYMSTMDPTGRMPLQCNFTEDDRCEMFFVAAETVYIKVTGTAIEGAPTQMIFDIMVLDSPHEVQRLMMEPQELVHSRVHRNHSMKVWWHATLEDDDKGQGTDDAVTVFRYDVPAGARAAVPPPDHFMAACSLRRWMQPDPAAQATVQLRATPTAEIVGSAIVGNLTPANTTFFAVVTTRDNGFGVVYKVLRLSAAATTTSTIAFITMLVSSVLIATLLIFIF